MEKPLVVAASDNEAMAKLAKSGLSATFDVFPLISKWSLEFQAGKEDGLKSISSVARRALQELIRLASSGHVPAAKSLHGILVSSVSHFDELCHGTEFQEHFELIARKKSVWPGLLSCDADLNKRNKQLLARLKLGTEAGLNYSGRQWTRDTPETSGALKLWGIVKVYREAWQNHKVQAKLIREYWEKRNRELGRPTRFRPRPRPLAINAERAKESRLHEQSQKLARNLQPLDRTNYKQWFEAAMPEFINVYGEDFENRKLFAGYWKNAAYKDEPMARALIRRDIKKKIQQAFRSIAPKSSSV
jgi:hypothetical protein